MYAVYEYQVFIHMVYSTSRPSDHRLDKICGSSITAEDLIQSTHLIPLVFQCKNALLLA